MLTMKLFILIFLLFTIQIFSHHTGGGGDFIQPNNNRFVDPFTGKREKPNDYFLFNYEMLKGERENRNIHTSTIFAEKILADGMFGLNFSAPFIYYEQKNRSNAGRYGKPYIGVKYLPLFNVNSSYILILETRLGFPSGKNGNRFAGGNYYVGITNFTAGYNLNRFTLVGKISGQFPLSGQGEIEKSENDGIPYPLRPQSDYFKKYLADNKYPLAGFMMWDSHWDTLNGR